MLFSNLFMKIGKLFTADLHVDCKVSLHFFKKGKSHFIDS